jgi:hypothetical protein
MRLLGVLGIVGLLLFGATSTVLASSPAVVSHVGFEAASTWFSSAATANARIARLVKHGFTGYTIEMDGQHFEVEKEFATAAMAQAEVTKLATATIRAHVETSSGLK